jgi:hypothetical protein
MPLNRLILLLFVLVLIGSLVYLGQRPGSHPDTAMTLSKKAYIERLEAERRESGR